MSRCQSTAGNCEGPQKFRCSGCIGIGLPDSLCAKYCGKECQSVSFPEHKKVHSSFKKSSSDSTGDFGRTNGYCQTVCLTFMELKAIDKLPVLRDDTLTILFAGARDECSIDFNKLFNLLKQFVFESLKTLNIHLVGPSCESYNPTNTASVKVTMKQKKIEAAYNTDSIKIFDAIIMIAPGFSSFVDDWTSAINLFTSTNVPIISTAYSSFENKDNDALFDDDCMIRYFRSKCILPITCNPNCEVFPSGPLGHKNRYYFICQGIDDSAPVIDRTTFKRQLSAKYLEFQADYYGWRDERFASSCRKLAKELLDGSFPYHHEKMNQLIDLARRM